VALVGGELGAVLGVVRVGSGRDVRVTHARWGRAGDGILGGGQRRCGEGGRRHPRRGTRLGGGGRAAGESAGWLIAALAGCGRQRAGSRILGGGGLPRARDAGGRGCARRRARRERYDGGMCQRQARA
jgi:hypothetical protein